MGGRIDFAPPGQPGRTWARRPFFRIESTDPRVERVEHLAYLPTYLPTLPYLTLPYPTYLPTLSSKHLPPYPAFKKGLTPKGADGNWSLRWGSGT